VGAAENAARPRGASRFGNRIHLRFAEVFRENDESRQTITVGGQTQQGYGTACRAPDGQWHVQPR
jgi:surface antigen